MANSAEQRYLEAQRELRSASQRLADLDRLATSEGAAIDRRTRLTGAGDPASAARELMAEEWPDRVELHEVVEAYLQAHSDSRHAWAALSPATQMRLAQPSEE